jgi:hypothetical protein
MLDPHTTGTVRCGAGRAGLVLIVAALVAGCYPTPAEEFENFIEKAAQRADDDTSGDSQPTDQSEPPDLPTMDGDVGELWPPPIVGVWNADAGCTLPECDESADAGFDPAGTWQRTLTTTASDCSATIQGIDPRAVVGNVAVDDEMPIHTLTGTCGYDETGTHVATVREGVIVSCQVNEQLMGALSNEVAVITYEGDVGTGQARIWLTNVPDAVGGDCAIEMDVEYQRQ